MNHVKAITIKEKLLGKEVCKTPLRVFFARGWKNTLLFLQSDWSIDFYRFLCSWTQKKVEHCSTFFSAREFFFAFVFSSASKNSPNGKQA